MTEQNEADSLPLNEGESVELKPVIDDEQTIVPTIVNPDQLPDTEPIKNPNATVLIAPPDAPEDFRQDLEKNLTTTEDTDPPSIRRQTDHATAVTMSDRETLDAEEHMSRQRAAKQRRERTFKPQLPKQED